MEETPSLDASVGWARPPWSDHRRNQAEAQPSQTNSSSHAALAYHHHQSSSAVMGRGGGARRRCPARQGAWPTPAVHVDGPCRPRGWRVPAVLGEPAYGALLASWRGLASPVYRWVFVLTVRSPFSSSSAPLPPTGCTRPHSVGLWVSEEPMAVKKLPTSGSAGVASLALFRAAPLRSGPVLRAELPEYILYNFGVSPLLCSLAPLSMARSLSAGSS